MWSAIKPCSSGTTAPPTIAATSNPDAFPVSGPSPAMASVKMLGNIIELNKPTRMRLHMETWPTVSMQLIHIHCTHHFNAGRRQCRAQNQPASEPWCECGTQRVEGLGQIQTAGGCVGWAEDCHVGIGRSLQYGHTRGQHNQGGKK